MPVVKEMERRGAVGEDAHGNVLAFVDALFGEETATRRLCHGFVPCLEVGLHVTNPDQTPSSLQTTMACILPEGFVRARSRLILRD